MQILINFLLIIILLSIFYIINRILKKQENFCYGNDFCNGNKEALCINQECRKCGIQAQCNVDSDCGPNNCINGCCDEL